MFLLFNLDTKLNLFLSQILTYLVFKIKKKMNILNQYLNLNVSNVLISSKGEITDGPWAVGNALVFLNRWS